MVPVQRFAGAPPAAKGTETVRRMVRERDGAFDTPRVFLALSETLWSLLNQTTGPFWNCCSREQKSRAERNLGKAVGAAHVPVVLRHR
jgi:hypothetical protein